MEQEARSATFPMLTFMPKVPSVDYKEFERGADEKSKKDKSVKGFDFSEKKP